MVLIVMHSSQKTSSILKASNADSHNQCLNLINILDTVCLLNNPHSPIMVCLTFCWEQSSSDETALLVSCTVRVWESDSQGFWLLNEKKQQHRASASASVSPCPGAADAALRLWGFIFYIKFSVKTRKCCKLAFLSLSLSFYSHTLSSGFQFPELLTLFKLIDYN